MLLNTKVVRTLSHLPHSYSCKHRTNATNYPAHSYNSTTKPFLCTVAGPPVPPPLPPRRERTTSDANSRSSVGSVLEERPLERTQDRTLDVPSSKKPMQRKHSVPNANEQSFNLETHCNKSAEDLGIDGKGFHRIINSIDLILPYKHNRNEN